MIDDQLVATLDCFDLTFAEYAILNLIHYECRAPSVAPRHALGLVETLDRTPDRADFENAIRHLHKRGLIVTVDRAVQRQVIAHLHERKTHGPTNGLPPLGTLDFTLPGALLYRKFLNARHDGLPRDYYWTSCVSFVYRRDATIVYCSTDDPGDALLYTDLTPIGELEPIGPWRVQWWRLIPNGYRLRCRPIDDGG